MSTALTVFVTPFPLPRWVTTDHVAAGREHMAEALRERQGRATAPALYLVSMPTKHARRNKDAAGMLVLTRENAVFDATKAAVGRGAAVVVRLWDGGERDFEVLPSTLVPERVRDYDRNQDIRNLLGRGQSRA